MNELKNIPAKLNRWTYKGQPNEEEAEVKDAFLELKLKCDLDASDSQLLELLSERFPGLQQMRDRNKEECEKHALAVHPEGSDNLFFQMHRPEDEDCVLMTRNTSLNKIRVELTKKCEQYAELVFSTRYTGSLDDLRTVFEKDVLFSLSTHDPDQGVLAFPTTNPEQQTAEV